MTPEEMRELIDEHFPSDEEAEEEENADDDEEENPWAGRPATVVGRVPWWDREA